MTFLNPLVLFGLAAAALPIIIHLLNLRRLRTVEFSSLQFLKELQRTKMRRLRIRQILLLLLRVLIIVALVLAFSRPALQGTSSGLAGGTAAATMALVIDDSPSMAVRNERGILFAQAKERAAAIAALAQQGDRIYLLPLSGIRRAESPVAMTSPAAARESIERMELSDETLPITKALQFAAKLLSASPTVNHELYLITDGQTSEFAAGGKGDTIRLPDPNMKLFLVTIPSNQPANVAAVDAEIKTKIVTVNKPVELEATVANFAPTEARDQTMSVYLEGERTVQQSVNVGPFSAVTSRLTLIPKHRGPLHGYVQIEDDPLEIDNKRYFVLDVPDNIRILLVGGSAADAHYASLALTLRGDSTLAGLLSVQQISETQLTSTDFNRFDVMVLCNIRDFAPVEAERIAQFVTAGGGVMLFPGPASNLGNYDKTLLAGLGIPPIGRDSSARQRSGTAQSFLSFEKVDYAHPLFAGLFETSPGKKNVTPSVESPKVYEAVKLQTAPHGHAVITLSNGGAFLAEYTPGRGRVFLFAVEAGLAGSDFPVKGLFAPLMHRSMLYLASENEGSRAFVAGEQLRCTVKLRTFAEQDAYLLKSPSGIDVRVVPNILSSNGVAEFTSGSSGEVGIYELRQAEQSRAGKDRAVRPPLGCVAVNVDTAESDLRVSGPDEIRALLGRAGVEAAQVNQLPASGPLEEAVRQTRFGVELWKHFLVIALVLALTEMVLARASRRPQPGDASP